MRGIRVLWIATATAAFCLAAPAAADGNLPSHHNADANFDGRIGLGELLRVIQFYNSNGYGCDPPGSDPPTEDGFRPGPGDEGCARHDSDYQDPPWRISLSELLRLIQIYNARTYGFDPRTEDGFTPIFTPEDTTATALGESGSLRGFVAAADDSAVDGPTKAELIDILLRAESAFVQNDPCGAADILDEALALTQAIRAGAGPQSAQARFTEVVFARAREAQYRMLAPDGTHAPCPGRERERQAPEFDVEESGVERVVARVRFGAARYLPVHRPLPDGSTEIFTQLIVPGLDSEGGAPGMPGIPCARRLIAVPHGASVALFEESAKIAETRTVNLKPFRVDPQDLGGDGDLPFPDREIFADRPFAIDEQVYATDRFHPAQPCSVYPLGLMRGLEVYLVEACAGQYNPVTRQLRLFAEMDLRVEFANGPPGFARGSMFQPFESNPNLHFGALINGSAIPAAPALPELVQPTMSGEELLILTHPNFAAAAGRLAEWKMQKGILTSVIQCGTATGIDGRETAAGIQAFIQDRHAQADVKPSYILLLGDTEFIPTHYVPRAQRSEDTSDTIGTDHPYAVIPVTGGFVTLDLLPTFAVGRIPVDNLEQADAVVDKIIAYEKTPPKGPAAEDYYRRVMLAAEFQCCRTDVDQEGTAQRTYTEAAEFVRPALLGRGYTAVRRYRRTVDAGCADCDPPRPPYTGDPTPRRFHDGTPIPDAIGPGSGFNWSVDTQNLSNLFNAGVVLAFHRDHGAPGGWGTPRFLTNSLPLANGALQPVVFSINCSSGVFDNETSNGAEGVIASGTYWAERILRQANGGAIGVIGATRLSPSWANTALSRGLFDAIFPEVVPGFGGQARHRRLGDILNHAKLYLATQLGATFIGGEAVRDMFFLYHVLGDPTLEFWTVSPSFPPIPPLGFGPVGQDFLQLSTGGTGYAGATLTLLQTDRAGDNVPVGRGVVAADGWVDITPFRAWDPDVDVAFAITREDIVTVDGLVRLAPD